MYEIQALQIITDAESTDSTLASVDSSNPAIDEIVIYLRASFIVLDKTAVIKITQDISFNSNNKERFVLYFFVAPQPGKTYIVYRAVVNYDSTTEEIRILILAFDLYISENKLVAIFNEDSQPLVSEGQNLDVDIAYGYETISVEAVDTDKNLKNIVGQINSKYALLTKGKSLQTIEMMELKSGKLNYKIIYYDATTHLTLKFMVYYNPMFQKILLLNTVNLPSSQQFQ